MPLPFRKTPSDQLLKEYSVYIFHDTATKEIEEIDWEKKITTNNKKRALAKAKKLYASNDYQRVEIKRKLLDPHNGVAIAQPYKIFQKRKGTRGFSFISTIIGIAALGMLLSAFILFFALS